MDEFGKSFVANFPMEMAIWVFGILIIASMDFALWLYNKIFKD